MGDPEYLAAFHRLVMPIAYEFNPELVLVSAGFDAARGDPLGGCLVSPECYAHMTHLLLGLAGGRVVIVLEGGYNLVSIAESMTMCTRTLLGDPPPPLGRLKPPHPSALQSLARSAAVQRRYWGSLRLPEPAPAVAEEPSTHSGKGTPVSKEPPPAGSPEPPQSPPIPEALEGRLVDEILALGSLQLSDNPEEGAGAGPGSASPGAGAGPGSASPGAGAGPGSASPGAGAGPGSASPG
uniref:Histone deacetylase domain-containing protein n=1 Tax=Sphenodon punctatus TaxID=8508 RepID=A0A8D0GNA2_SPHPU